MVRILPFLVSSLSIASQALAALHGSELSAAEVDLAPRTITAEASVEAALYFGLELDISADLVVGLGGLNLDLGVDLDLGLGLKGRKGLSVDVCIQALLANVVLYLDSQVACTGPSTYDLKHSVTKGASVPCTCSDPTVSLQVVIPDISLDVQASQTLIAEQAFVFLLTKSSKTYTVVASKPKMEWPEPKTCAVGYEKHFKCD